MRSGHSAVPSWSGMQVSVLLSCPHPKPQSPASPCTLAHLQAGDLQLAPVRWQQVGQPLLCCCHFGAPALHLGKPLAVPAGRRGGGGQRV